MSKNKRETVFFFYYVKEYIENMRIELKSQKTIETYRTGLNDLRKYFFSEHGKTVDQIAVNDVTSDTVKEYLHWLIENGCSMNTRNIRLAAIKSYLIYAASKYVQKRSSPRLITGLAKLRWKSYWNSHPGLKPE